MNVEEIAQRGRQAYWGQTSSVWDWGLLDSQDRAWWIQQAQRVLAGHVTLPAQYFGSTHVLGWPHFLKEVSKYLVEVKVQDKGDKRLQERDAAQQALVIAKADLANALETMGSVIRETRYMFDNLTATQKRCTELLDETRALKRELALRPARSTGHDHLP